MRLRSPTAWPDGRGRETHHQTKRSGASRRTMQKFTTIQAKPPTMPSTLATRQWLSFCPISATFPLLQKTSSHFLSFALICSKFPAKSGPPLEQELGRLCSKPTNLCRKRTNSVGICHCFDTRITASPVHLLSQGMRPIICLSLVGRWVVRSIRILVSRQSLPARLSCRKGGRAALPLTTLPPPPSTAAGSLCPVASHAPGLFYLRCSRSSRRTCSMSASTIMRINSVNETVGSQPNTRRALLASPRRVLISAGRNSF